MAAFPYYDGTATTNMIVQVDCTTGTVSSYVIPTTVASNYVISASTPDYLFVYGRRFLRSQYEQAKIYSNECWSRTMWAVPKPPAFRAARPVPRPVIARTHRRLVRTQSIQNKRRFYKQRIRREILA